MLAKLVCGTRTDEAILEVGRAPTHLPELHLPKLTEQVMDDGPLQASRLVSVAVAIDDTGSFPTLQLAEIRLMNTRKPPRPRAGLRRTCAPRCFRTCAAAGTRGAVTSFWIYRHNKNEIDLLF